MRAALTGETLASAVFGALQVEATAEGVRPWRLPAEQRRFVPASLSLMAEFAAGVRVRVLTAAAELRLDVTVTRLAQAGQAELAPAPFVAVVDGVPVARIDLAETGIVTEELAEPERRFVRGPRVRSSFALRVGGADRERVVEVWLPQDAAVLIHSVSADAPLRAAEPEQRPRWIHYGSSISHGGSADGPLGTWPALAAARLGVDGVNLGFGGNAMLDPQVARAVAEQPADLVTLKVGINIVGADAMRRRAFLPALHGFLDTVRSGHPETPVVLVTPIACLPVEGTPGPIGRGADGRATGTPRATRPGDGTLTLRAVRAAVCEVAEARGLPVIDGLALLGLDEADEYLPDALHPSPAGHALIAGRFAELVRPLLA